MLALNVCSPLYDFRLTNEKSEANISVTYQYAYNDGRKVSLTEFAVRQKILDGDSRKYCTQSVWSLSTVTI